MAVVTIGGVEVRTTSKIYVVETFELCVVSDVNLSKSSSIVVDTSKNNGKEENTSSMLSCGVSKAISLMVEDGIVWTTTIVATQVYEMVEPKGTKSEVKTCGGIVVKTIFITWGVDPCVSSC